MAQGVSENVKEQVAKLWRLQPGDEMVCGDPPWGECVSRKTGIELIKVEPSTRGSPIPWVQNPFRKQLKVHHTSKMPDELWELEPTSSKQKVQCIDDRKDMSCLCLYDLNLLMDVVEAVVVKGPANLPTFDRMMLEDLKKRCPGPIKDVGEAMEKHPETFKHFFEKGPSQP